MSPRRAAASSAFLVLVAACSGSVDGGGDDGDGGGNDAAPDGDGGVAGGDGGGAVCEVSPDARALFEALVAGQLADAVRTAAGTRAEAADPAWDMLGNSARLVGVPSSRRGGALVHYSDCSPRTPSCVDDPFLPGDDRLACQMMGCGDDDVPYVTLYWTVAPEMSPFDRHAFAFATTQPAGEAVADPNPLVTWRHDLTMPGAAAVSAALDVGLTITPTGGAAVVLDHTGEATATRVGDAVTAAGFDAVFPAFVAGGAATLAIEVDGAGAASGALTQGGLTLATFGGTVGQTPALVTTWCP